MRNSVIARRYARALFEIACERDILESVTNEVTSFEESLQSNSRFRLFLISQDVSKKAKIARLESILEDRVSSVFLNFLFVLLRKKREAIFSDIAREYFWMVDEQKKRIHAFATTAVPLDSKATARLKSILDEAFGLDVQIDSLVDESILGGIVVSVKGQLLDGSLKGQLRRLKSQLLENTNLN